MEQPDKAQKKRVLTIVLLNFLLLFYSLSGICSKMAAGAPWLSLRFLLFYGGVIGILGVYAILWQQIIKVLPLTVAYTNRAVVLLWAMLWGILFFEEKLTAGKLCGALMIIAGIVLFAHASQTEGE